MGARDAESGLKKCGLSVSKKNKMYRINLSARLQWDKVVSGIYI